MDEEMQRGAAISVNLNWMVFILFMSVVAKLLHNVAGVFCSLMVQVTVKEPPSTSNLRYEVAQLRKELQSINPTDDFVVHARMQRTIIQKEAELNRLEFTYTNTTQQRKALLQRVCSIIIEVTRVSFIVPYRYVPVLQLPPEYFWPLTYIIGFPTGIPGAVGPMIWGVLCRQFVETSLSLVPRKKNIT